MTKQTRQDYIRTMLDKHGHVQKKDIIKEFGVSAPTAASDLQLFGIQNDDVQYNSSTHRHEKVVERKNIRTAKTV